MNDMKDNGRLTFSEVIKIMNKNRKLTFLGAIKIIAWIITVALFCTVLRCIFKVHEPIAAIGFFIVGFCFCPLSAILFKKLKSKTKINLQIPAIILSLFIYRGLISLNSTVINAMKNNNDNAVTTIAETTITEQMTTAIIETTTEKATTVTKITTEETTESETTVTETTIPPIITTILETEPPQTFPPVTEAPKIVVKTYVLNTSTMKVHTSTCRDVDKISYENYAECDDLQWAFDNGYEPCGHCHPH